MADDARTERAEAILDQIFTPAWRTHGRRCRLALRGGPRLRAARASSTATATPGRAPGIDLKTRSLLTLTVLATLGNEHELKLHVQGALNLGHQPDDVVELFIHLMPYIGVPRVVAAMRLAGEVFRASAWPGAETARRSTRTALTLPDARLRRRLLPRAAGDASRRSSRAARAPRASRRWAR